MKQKSFQIERNFHKQQKVMVIDSLSHFLANLLKSKIEKTFKKELQYFRHKEV